MAVPGPRPAGRASGAIVAVLLRRGACDAGELAAALPDYLGRGISPAEVERVLRREAAGPRPLVERGCGGRWRISPELLRVLCWRPPRGAAQGAGLAANQP